MKQGWIKVQRALLEHGIFYDAELLQIWLYCLLQASYRQIEIPIGSRMIELKPGQLLYGRRAVSHRLHITEGQLRRCMALLEQMGAITIERTNRYSVVTIVNWNKYQAEGGQAFPFDCDFIAEDWAEEQDEQTMVCQLEQQSGTGIEPKICQKKTSSQPAVNHKQEEKKNNKKDKQIINQEKQNNQETGKQDKTAAVQQAADANKLDEQQDAVKPQGAAQNAAITFRQAEAMLDRLWQQYPVQKGRYRISQQQIIKLAQVGEDRMQAAIRNYCAQMQDRPIQYWQHGGTFFNGGYEDFLDSVSDTAVEKQQWEGL